MQRLFIYTRPFDRKLKDLKDHLNLEMNIEKALLGNPEIGDIIEGTHGLRKFRFAYGGHGKSGGIRILYFDLKSVQKTYLIAFFHKNEKENLSKEERNAIGQMVLQIKKEAERGAHT